MLRVSCGDNLFKQIVLSIVVRPAAGIAFLTVVFVTEDLEFAFFGFAPVNADAVRPFHAIVVELTPVDMIDGEILRGAAFNAFTAKLLDEFDVGTTCPVFLTFAHLPTRTKSGRDCWSGGSVADFLFKLEDFLADDFASLW